MFHFLEKKKSTRKGHTADTHTHTRERERERERERDLSDG